VDEFPIPFLPVQVPVDEQCPSGITLVSPTEQLLSGVHSIMMEKFAQAGQGGDARTPIPFSIYLLFTIPYKVAVYALAERADTFLHSPYFISIPMYSVVSRCRLNLQSDTVFEARL
jgi:hypothetical protein